MNPRSPLLTCLVALVLFATPAVGQQTPEELYQAAIYKHQVEGDLQGAVEILQELIDNHSEHREVAARALVLLGRVHETMGSANAERAYRRVLNEYPEQRGAADEARARLAALRPAAVAGRGPVARRVLTNADLADPWSLIGFTPSPDGRRVAYVDLNTGRLVMRDLASGAEEELVANNPDSSWNDTPVWSPDGTRLAFLRMDAGRTGVWAIKIVDLTSRTVTVVPGTESSPPAEPIMRPVAWSRDGRFLLYSRTGFRDRPPKELGTVPVGGGARHPLADSVWWGSLSPDGRHVAYTIGERGSEQVFIQPVDGGARRQVTSAPGGNRSPVWSPDGSHIAYVRRDGIWVVPVADGSAAGALRLAYASETAFAWTAPAWTAAGLYVSEVYQDGIPYRIEVDLATGTVTDAMEELPQHPAYGAGPFAWSPDMRHIAFGSYAGDIVIYGVGGGSVASHAVAPYQRVVVLSWSQDGREVYFRHWSELETGQAVMALDVTTGHVREVAPRLRRRFVRSVSADARSILYFQSPDEDEATPDGLIVGSADRPGGTQVVPITDVDGLRLIPRGQCISPQGDRVAFARSARRGTSDDQSLWVVGSDGTGLRRVATIKEISGYLWDRSGRFIAYTGRLDSATAVLRIVDAATGVERGSSPLPSQLDDLDLIDWSSDGRLIGFVNWEPRWEYWVVQGLLDTAR